MTRAILQVALDLLDMKRALQIAQESLDGGADWIEAGTPLIKSEGIGAVRQLRDRFKKATIVADMKVADTGAIEVEMAAKAGADIVCILADADDAVVADAVRAARLYGIRLMADLINVKDPQVRAGQLEAMGVDIICAHVGIDQQMTGQGLARPPFEAGRQGTGSGCSCRGYRCRGGTGGCPAGCRDRDRRRLDHPICGCDRIHPENTGCHG